MFQKARRSKVPNSTKFGDYTDFGMSEMGFIFSNKLSKLRNPIGGLGCSFQEVIISTCFAFIHPVDKK